MWKQYAIFKLNLVLTVLFAFAENVDSLFSNSYHIRVYSRIMKWLFNSVVPVFNLEEY